MDEIVGCDQLVDLSAKLIGYILDYRFHYNGHVCGASIEVKADELSDSSDTGELVKIANAKASQKKVRWMASLTKNGGHAVKRASLDGIIGPVEL